MISSRYEFRDILFCFALNLALLRMSFLNLITVCSLVIVSISDNFFANIITLKTKSKIKVSLPLFVYICNYETHAQGGYNLFTPNPGDVSGNVRCESENGLATLGYVTSSSYATIDGKLDTRFRKTQPINYDNYIKLESSDDIQLYYEVYHMVPIFRTWGAVYWGGEECLDCRLRGGTLEKPSF